MRIKDPKTTALIFSSGKMVCTGAKSEEESRKAARKFAKIIKSLGFKVDFKEFKVQNIVGSCDIRFKIHLTKLNSTLNAFKSKIKKKKSTFDSCLKKLPENIYVFRPPNIWNYPYHRLFKLKHQNEGDNVITEIRNVDPTICYKDNRVQKFMALFTQIYDNMKTYWRTEKPNTWDYFFNKVLKALGISYVSYKMLREEEEEQKKKQEEDEKKRKEEEENESKQKEMIEFLEKHTHETYIEKKMEEDFKKEQEEKEAKENEKEKGKGKKDAKKKK